MNSNDDCDSPMSLSRQVDRCAWNSNRRGGRVAPRIEDYLARAPEQASQAARRELIALEVELRRAEGNQVDREEYRGRFPDHTAEVDAAFELVSRGHRPDSVLTPTESGNTCGVPKTFHVRPAPRGDTPAMPQTLGRYRIQKCINRGGFGKVYLAEDAELGRLVALKCRAPTAFLPKRSWKRFSGKPGRPSSWSIRGLCRFTMSSGRPRKSSWCNGTCPEEISGRSSRRGACGRSGPPS